MSHTHELNDNAALFHSGMTRGGGSAHEGTAESSDRQDLLSASEIIEELEDNDGKSANNVCGSTSGEYTVNNNNSQTPPTKSNASIPDMMEGTQVLEACNGPISSPDVVPHDLHAGSASYSDRGCKQNIDQAPSEVNGHIGFNKEHNTISKDDSMQTNEISPTHPTAETSFNTTGPHDDASVPEAHDSSSATCNTEQLSQATSPSISRLEPEAPHGSDVVDSGENVSKAAVVPSETPSTSFFSEEANKPTHAIKTMDKSSKIFQVASSVNELPRAKTMPSGSLEVVNGEVRPSRPSTFKRSSTDKTKGGGDVHSRTPRTPGPKISKRKQKKLMKKMCTMQKDGTVELDLERSARFAPNIFEPDEWEDYYSTAGDEDDGKAVPPLQIVILIVGTRGDVQPFVAIGKRLQEHGHRVRLATHSNFEDFVLKAGLEFYPLGGDPKVLAGYMVKNKGFLPSGPSEIRTQKKQLKSIINSLLPACIQPHKTGGVPFKAQAIIANPPAYGHVHVAEALQVPLHIFFTMPWTPTNEFPHPLSRVGHFAANRLSYQVVDSLVWVGIRGIINDFRKKKLNLRPITYLGGSQQSVSKLPTGYIWSPHLVPKPKDWGPKIDVVGFCFLNLSQDYKPPDQLVEWLAAGPPPIYIGFGSLPVEDPSGMTKIILNALQETSQRGIIDKGWGGIGTMVELPESVYLLDNCPHDWLFSRCAAVVHHGGAGTTAAGLKAACPTTIVPFFGDQAFWGERVHARGVGPPPIPVAQFSLDKLVNAMWFMLDNEVKQRAISLAEAMKEEDGVEGAVAAFHRHLPRDMPRAPASLPKKKPHRVSLPCF